MIYFCQNIPIIYAHEGAVANTEAHSKLRGIVSIAKCCELPIDIDS